METRWRDKLKEAGIVLVGALLWTWPLGFNRLAAYYGWSGHIGTWYIWLMVLLTVRYCARYEL